MNIRSKIKNKIKKSLFLPSLTFNYKGSLKQKCLYYRFAKIAQRNGVIPFRVDRVAADYVDGWYGVTDMTGKEKMWYISHGFNPNRKAWYNVGPDNYKSFMSDFEFYRPSSYVNLPFNVWFDNKLTTYYILSQFKNYQPVHYCYLRKGHLLPIDCPHQIELSFAELLSMLKNGPIALKKCVGGHGDGFMKLHSDEGHFFLNDAQVSESDLQKKIESLDGYIVTEFVKPHSAICEVIGDDNFAVMRAMTVFDPQDGPQIIGMMIRFGTTKAGHTQAGNDHFYMNVNPKTGSVSDAVYFYSDFSYERNHIHPETQRDLEDIVIPNIDAICQVALNVSASLSVTPYLVMDIIPAENGPKILEINSHGQPFIVDQFVRVKENKYFCKLFKESFDL